MRSHNGMQGQLPRPTDIMSLRIDNGERATLEYADIALSPTRYIASWLRQRGWRLPDYRCLSFCFCALSDSVTRLVAQDAVYSITDSKCWGFPFVH